MILLSAGPIWALLPVDLVSCDLPQVGLAEFHLGFLMCGFSVEPFTSMCVLVLRLNPSLHKPYLADKERGPWFLYSPSSKVVRQGCPVATLYAGKK